jgi:hypothetical protein
VRQSAIALKAVANIGGGGGRSRVGSEARLLEAVKTFLTSLSCVMLNQAQHELAPPEIHSKQPEMQDSSASASHPHRPVSLALIRLRTWSRETHNNISYELHVQAEAALAACLVLCLRRCAMSPLDDIFVATPHCVQREAVKAALGRMDAGGGRGGAKVTVDTIERLQGQIAGFWSARDKLIASLSIGSEAAFVICLFSVPQSYSADLSFLLERRRLNVAISRARTLCILVSSDEVLCPSVKIFANAEAAKGYAFLKAFQMRAWSYCVALPVDDFA